MASEGRPSDAQNLLMVVAIALGCTLGAVFWLSESMQTRGQSQEGSSFHAVQPIPEGAVRTCPHCQGKGKAACSNCGGQGKVWYIPGGLDWCKVCSGYKTSPCTRCRGKGTISEGQPAVLRAGGSKKP